MIRCHHGGSSTPRGTWAQAPPPPVPTVHLPTSCRDCSQSKAVHTCDRTEGQPAAYAPGEEGLGALHARTRSPHRGGDTQPSTARQGSGSRGAPQQNQAPPHAIEVSHPWFPRGRVGGIARWKSHWGTPQTGPSSQSPSSRALVLLFLISIFIKTQG